MLALALLVCGAIGITVSAEGDASLTIAGKNLSFENEPRLVFAISSENVETEEISVVYSESADMADAKTAISLGDMNVNGTSLPAFALEEVNPKDVDKVFYVQAVAGDTASAVVKYSVLEWALEGAVTTDKAIFDAAVAYYAAVQDELGYEGTHADEYKYVKVVDGKIGEADSVLTTEDSVTLTYTGSSAISGWNIEYIDGTTATANPGTVAITKSCKITPKLLETLTVGETFDSLTTLKGDGSDSKVCFGNSTLASTGAPTSGDTIELAADPTGAANKVLKFVDGITSGASTVGANETNNYASNDSQYTTSVFETKLYIAPNESTSTGVPFAEIYFTAGRSQMSTKIRLYTQSNNTYAVFNVSGATIDSTGAETTNKITTNAWHIIRLEMDQHLSTSGKTSIIRIYIDGLYAGSYDSTINFDGKNINRFMWNSYSTNTSTVYFDNMSLTEKVTAYPTEE